MSSSRNLFPVLSKFRSKARTLVVEKVTPSIIKVAEETGIKNIVAKTFVASSEKINLVSL